MELVFVRHGQPDWEPGGLAVDEPGLTRLGRAQAERVAEHLRGEGFDAAYVSPLRRARETAAPLERTLSSRLRVQSWLAELQMPPLEGTPVEEVQKFFEDARLRDLEAWWDGMPGGESFRHFQNRVAAGIEAVLEAEHGARMHLDGAHRIWRIRDPEQRLVFVAHAGTIAVMLSHLLGIEQVPWAVERFSLGWAGISRIRTLHVASGSIWSLASFNERTHLTGLDDPPG
jgi:probable phosphoglycerate mutase